MLIGVTLGLAIAGIVNVVKGDTGDGGTKPVTTHERTEIHHEPTVINKPTKETVREVTRWRTAPAPVLPDTGGQSDLAPDMSKTQHNSPVQLGDDVGRLEASRRIPDSVLVACKRDPGQPTVYSRGRRNVGSHIFSVSDRSADGHCERNFTGRRLKQHWLEQGRLQSTVSNHD